MKVREQGSCQEAPVSQWNTGVARSNNDLRNYWIWAAAFVVAALLWLPRLSGPIDLRWDGSVYYLLGASLADGQGYRIHSEPGAPEAIQYPPLLPAFVAAHAKLLGTTRPEIVTPYLRISYAAIFLVYGLAVVTLARRFLPPVFALIATLICLLYSETIFFSDLLYAEIPFALISVLFILTASSFRRPSWLNEIGSFLLAAVGFLLRTAGIVLLIAWVLDAMIARRWRSAILRFVLALLPVIGWHIHVDRVRTSDAYRHPAYAYQRAPYQYSNVSYSENAQLIDPFHPERGRLKLGTFVKRLTGNAPRMIAAVGETVGAKKKVWDGLFSDLQAHHEIVPVHPLTMISVLLFSMFAFAGILILIKRGAILIVFILIGSMALALTTPWRLQFTRYLVPLGSFLSISMTLAVATIREQVQRAKIKPERKTIVNYALLAMLVIVLTVHLFAVVKMFTERSESEGRLLAGPKWPSCRFFVHDPTWQNLERAAQWVAANAPPDAIVASSVPHFFFLLTGRLSIIPPLIDDPVRARQLLSSVPVSYVIVDQLQGLDMSRTYAQPAVDSDPDHWRLAFAADRTSIYARIKAPAPLQQP